MESTIKSCLNDLLNNNYLSQEHYKFLKPCGRKPGIMDGLCKVHKFNPVTNDVPPFRLIFSAIGTLTYNLAKCFAPIFKEYTINEYTVQDSSIYMAFFDIQSLFTNIPLEQTIDKCVNIVLQHKKKVKGILKRYKQLLTLTEKYSCFVLNNVYYK